MNKESKVGGGIPGGTADTKARAQSVYDRVHLTAQQLEFYGNSQAGTIGVASVDEIEQHIVNAQSVGLDAEKVKWGTSLEDMRADAHAKLMAYNKRAGIRALSRKYGKEFAQKFISEKAGHAVKLRPAGYLSRQAARIVEATKGEPPKGMVQAPKMKEQKVKPKLKAKVAKPKPVKAKRVPLSEIKEAQEARTPLAKLRDYTREHKTVITPSSPRVPTWEKHPGSMDIRGIDTPSPGKIRAEQRRFRQLRAERLSRSTASSVSSSRRGKR